MSRRVVLLMGVAVLAIAGIAVAAKGGTSSGVVLCVANGSGEVTLGSKQGKCGKGERKLVVGQRGARGPQGKPGARGPAGAAGKPLSLAGEAAHSVAPATEGACKDNPGTFCGTPDGIGTWHESNSYPLTYRKDAAGWVYVTGPTSSSGGSETQFGEVATIFYLPPGYRPTDGIRRFYTKGGSCSTPGYLYYVDVYPNGAVKPQGTAQNSCYDLSKLVFHP